MKGNPRNTSTRLSEGMEGGNDGAILQSREGGWMEKGLRPIEETEREYR